MSIHKYFALGQPEVGRSLSEGAGGEITPKSS